MSFFTQTVFLAFRRPRIERRFQASSFKTFSTFRREVLLLTLVYQSISQFLSIKTPAFLILWALINRPSVVKSSLRVFLLIQIANLLISHEIHKRYPQDPIFLVVWILFLAISTQQTIKSMFGSSVISFLSVSLIENSPFIDFERFGSLLQTLPLAFLLTFCYEKQIRFNFMTREKELMNLKSKAQILDIFSSPILVVCRKGQILYSNTQASELQVEPANKSLFALISKGCHATLETALSETMMNTPAIQKKLEFLAKNEVFDACFQGIFFENVPAILVTLNKNRIVELMLTNFSKINKSLSKMSSSLLEKMEDDYNKWSNLQSLKYIKQSDMKTLASCVMESNYLKCLIHANLVKTYILLHPDQPKKPKTMNFNLRNTLVQILEMVSVQAIPKHQELYLKFEESFPDKVLGNPHRLKQGLLILIRQMATIYPEKSAFTMNCRLKELKQNQFIVKLMVSLPENEEFFCLLKKIAEDENSLSFNINNHTYSSFDILMFKPLMSLLAATMCFEPDSLTFSIEVPFAPASEFEAKPGVINNTTPILLSFCRVNPDRNTYRWKEVPFANSEKEKSAPARLAAAKFKKIAMSKELPRETSKPVLEESEQLPPVNHGSSKEITEQPSSKEESPELEHKQRKKTHSLFCKDGVKDPHVQVLIMEESKAESEFFMTPYHNNNQQQDFRIKAIIQEDLKDLEQSPKPKPIIKDFSQNSTGITGAGLEPEGEEKKPPPFGRSIYENLFKSWKSHEKTLKRMLMNSVYRVLSSQKEPLTLRFAKDQPKDTLKKRLKSLPTIRTSFTNIPLQKDSKKTYSQTPQWSNRQLKSRLTRKADFFEERKVDLEQEKLAFLSSRMVLSPRASVVKKLQFMFGHAGPKITKSYSHENEVLKMRQYTVRRRWLVQREAI